MENINGGSIHVVYTRELNLNFVLTIIAIAAAYYT